jgi:cell wall-associated NlpC family hydrolase
MTDDGGQIEAARTPNPSSDLRRLSSDMQRAAVVAEARSWLGTPYHNCADIKGAGVDCGMLLVRVFVDTGLIPPFDPRPYPIDWHLHRDHERYLGFVFDRGFGEVAEAQPGDIWVLRYGRCYSHGGIVVRAAPLRIIHAFHPARRVIEEEVKHNSVLSDPTRKPRVFSYWVNSAGARAERAGANGLVGGGSAGARK